MKLVRALGGIAAAAILVLTLTPAGEAAPQAVACAPLHVYAVRGSEEVGPFGNQIGPVVDELARLRPGGVSAQGNSYPAVIWELSWGRPDLAHTYAESVRDGVRRMQSDLAALRANCPGSDVAVIGYSQGSDVIRRTLASQKPDPRIRVHLLADPNFDSEDPFLPMVNDIREAITSRTGISLGINHFFFDDIPENPFALGPIPLFPPGWNAISLCWRKDPACGGGLGGLPFRWGDDGAHVDYHLMAPQLAREILAWSDSRH
ncbi:cutinase family protein [Actinokineospora spheciospongiae]|uniref:cutinase family protein n=1 Tax=Actinokineospora spheciospongiae TaxID=909613 RepID=UPI000D716647|nr:cutinase family protein [Actinokineospora spheciospongiae]PWW65392.1 hypothetical protein DFQ13_102142 [Actinokineospora spheciospongiae]